jgi:predicted nuclease with TOPRIM domain
MAIKPVEFPNLKELKAELERLRSENKELKMDVNSLEQELREARGEVFYDRANRVKNLHLPALAPPVLKRTKRWGDEEDDDCLLSELPDTCVFTDDPNDW